MATNDDNRPEEGEEEDEFMGNFEGVYVVDEDTQRLIEVVVGMISMLGRSQVDEQAQENCFIIGEELAQRFGVRDDFEVEEIIHGDEILYRPRGGVMGDDEPEEGEAPSGKPK